MLSPPTDIVAGSKLKTYRGWEQLSTGYGLYSCGLYGDGPYSYGLYSYGLYGDGLYSYGLYSYGLGLYSYIVMAHFVAVVGIAAAAPSSG